MVISLAEARAHVLDRCPGPVVSEVPLADARGLVTAAPVVATGAVPPFANSAMDGFALLAADTVGPPADLRIVGPSWDNAANTNRLDGYELLDLRASFGIGDNLELFGRVENVFDFYYQTKARDGTAGLRAFAGNRAKM